MNTIISFVLGFIQSTGISAALSYWEGERETVWCLYGVVWMGVHALIAFGVVLEVFRWLGRKAAQWDREHPKL